MRVVRLELEIYSDYLPHSISLYPKNFCMRLFSLTSLAFIKESFWGPYCRMAGSVARIISVVWVYKEEVLQNRQTSLAYCLGSSGTLLSLKENACAQVNTRVKTDILEVLLLRLQTLQLLSIVETWCIFGSLKIANIILKIIKTETEKEKGNIFMVLNAKGYC